MTKRILIVEDELISFVVAKKLFENTNCEIKHAPSGEDAIDLFAASLTDGKPFDAIGMDLGLPESSGINTCKLIREYENDAGIQPIVIIAVTANDSIGTVEECMAAGMMDVIFKPLTPDKVAHFLSKCPV